MCQTIGHYSNKRRFHLFQAYDLYYIFKKFLDTLLNTPIPPHDFSEVYPFHPRVNKTFGCIQTFQKLLKLTSQHFNISYHNYSMFQSQYHTLVNSRLSKLNGWPNSPHPRNVDVTYILSRDRSSPSVSVFIDTLRSHTESKRFVASL